MNAKEALEQAAKLCDERARKDAENSRELFLAGYYDDGKYWKGRADGGWDLATRIRQLADGCSGET